MENILKVCGIAVLCAAVGMVVGALGGGVGAALKACGLALVLGIALSMLGDVVATISELGDFAGAEEYISVMLRALAILWLCRICSDICRDCGQSGIAGAVEGAGKICLVLLALPLVGEILTYARQMLDRL